MRFYFRPFPGLTLFTLISLMILISLGTWQYHRLQWKTALLAEIDAAAEAEAFASIADVERALSSGKPVDFRRIAFTGEIIDAQTPYLVFTPLKTGPAWRPYFAVESQGRTAFVAMSPVGDKERETEFAKTAPYDVSDFAGYVRLARLPGRLAPKNTPEQNRWFTFNPLPDTHNWADSVPGGVITDFYIDAVPNGAKLGFLPPKKPDIRNNHLDYMLTWYSFAVILLIIYFILHYRRGRIGRKPSQ